MNYTPSAIRADDPHQDVLPGLEHIDMRYADDDPGATWIADLIAAVRRQGIKLVLWLLICFAASLAYTLRATPEYVASAQIVLEPRARLPAGADAAAAVAPILDSAQAESQLQIIRSVRNLSYVFDTLNLDADPAFAPGEPGLISRIVAMAGLLRPSSETPPTREELASQAREIAFQNFSDRVQVRRLGQSYVIEVSFRGLKPEATARITNSIAAAYIRDQVLVHAISEQRGTEFLQGRITLVQAEKKAADEAVATGVITDFQFPDSDARIVGAALRPLAAAYPQTKLNLLFGIVFGFVTGVAFIAIRNNFDKTVRSPAQIRRVLGVDCLVAVPRLRSGRLKDTTALDQPGSDFAQSMRLLRTVLFAARVKNHQVAIGVVSCREGEGCSALSANLAGLLAASNSRVVLVDASLQKPDLTRRFAPDSAVGLDQFILSTSTDARLPEVKITDSLSFVPAVAAGRAADPNAFLGTQAMRTALTQYNGPRDLVLDLPPLEASSDAQAIGSMLSGVVLVAALNRTKLNQLSEGVRALRSANSRVLGVVLNDPLPRRGRRSSRSAASGSSYSPPMPPSAQS
jgi:Mrp family chromosome partitioning ATPase